jgi:hypothetical protein
MLLTCANPECRVGFDHEQGRFFRLHRTKRDGQNPADPAVQDFWLCGRCAESYTIEYLNGSIALTSRAPHIPRPQTARHFIAAA